MESLGWLLMVWLRDKIGSSTVAGAPGLKWWIPPAPPWASVDGWATVPGTTNEILGFIMQEQTFTTRQPDGATAFDKWRLGPAGKSWRLEKGLDTPSVSSGPQSGPGHPFYADVVPAGIPPRVNYRAERTRIEGVWNARVVPDSFRPPDGGPSNGEQIRFLTKTAPKREAQYLNPVNVRFVDVSLKGLELAYDYPLLAKHTGFLRTKVRVLRQLEPVFSSLFETLYQLGWNDLLFQIQGSAYFRGQKRTRKAGESQAAFEARALPAARKPSNHSFGAAVDVNVVENPQNQFGKWIDPRIVGCFEAFGFKYLGCAQPPDPQHFEYPSL
jgi:hypothetical protein